MFLMFFVNALKMKNISIFACLDKTHKGHVRKGSEYSAIVALSCQEWCEKLLRHVLKLNCLLQSHSFRCDINNYSNLKMENKSSIPLGDWTGDKSRGFHDEVGSVFGTHTKSTCLQQGFKHSQRSVYKDFTLYLIETLVFT